MDDITVTSVANQTGKVMACLGQIKFIFRFIREHNFQCRDGN